MGTVRTSSVVAAAAADAAADMFGPPGVSVLLRTRSENRRYSLVFGFFRVTVSSASYAARARSFSAGVLVALSHGLCARCLLRAHTHTQEECGTA